MVSLRTYAPAVVSAYLRRGQAGVDELAERLEREAHERPDGKFGKEEAAYLPQSPLPPTLWRMSCGRCRFWEEGEPGEPGHCHIVGREGDGYGGEAIHYRGWCGYWTPPAGEPPLAWLKERVRPDGKSSVRGTYDPELTARKRRREARASTGRDARGGEIPDEMGTETAPDGTGTSSGRTEETPDEPGGDDGE